MSDWREGYLEAVKEFLMTDGGGQWVDLRHYGESRYAWDNQDPTEYSSWNTTYGWAGYHYVKGKTRFCRPVNIDMSTLRERSLSQFDGTFTENKVEVGLEVRGTCECGEYTDKWWRWTGTIGDILPNLLGLEVTTYYD